jgi:hypothetical protein
VLALGRDMDVDFREIELLLCCGGRNTGGGSYPWPFGGTLFMDVVRFLLSRNPGSLGGGDDGLLELICCLSCGT